MRHKGHDESNDSIRTPPEARGPETRSTRPPDLKAKSNEMRLQESMASSRDGNLFRDRFCSAVSFERRIDFRRRLDRVSTIRDRPAYILLSGRRRAENLRCSGTIRGDRAIDMSVRLLWRGARPAEHRKVLSHRHADLETRNADCGSN